MFTNRSSLFSNFSNMVTTSTFTTTTTNTKANPFAEFGMTSVPMIRIPPEQAIQSNKSAFKRVHEISKFGNEDDLSDSSFSQINNMMKKTNIQSGNNN